MSRANIISIVPVGAEELAVEDAVAPEIGIALALASLATERAIDVTFKMRRGGTATYRYSGDDAEAILAGDDPAGFLRCRNCCSSGSRGYPNARH